MVRHSRYFKTKEALVELVAQKKREIHILYDVTSSNIQQNILFYFTLYFLICINNFKLITYLNVIL